ncbi:unnamed protein product [Colias eurytheme]|nr:unnamed protein product [Colias eurytheme]
MTDLIHRNTPLGNKLTKFIRIGIADKNDNPPYFDKELYEAEVDENEDIQHTVLTVTAKDHDECKSYYYYVPNISSNVRTLHLIELNM